MMAVTTWNSNLVPLLEGRCSSNPRGAWRPSALARGRHAPLRLPSCPVNFRTTKIHKNIAPIFFQKSRHRDSDCAICQNYMFSGGSNTPPFFRRLKQIWKTESITVAQPTGIPDSRRAAAYVCVNAACTSSIILQARNTADVHPLIIRSPSYYSLTYVTNAVGRKLNLGRQCRQRVPGFPGRVFLCRVF